MVGSPQAGELAFTTPPLQVIIPWLQNLINPAQVQTLIHGLDASLVGQLNPVMINLTRDLSQAVRLPPDGTSL